MKLIIATCTVCGLREKQVDSEDQKKIYICTGCKNKLKKQGEK
jgi:hypothetical protein